MNHGTAPILPSRVPWRIRAFGYLRRRGARRNFNRLKSLGVGGSLRRISEVIRSATELWLSDRFDDRLGADTAGDLSIDELTVPIEARHTAHGFRSIPAGCFRRAIRCLRLPLEDFVFVDVGCGKGRALLVAAEFPFRQLIGVEHAEDLVFIARRNVAAARKVVRGMPAVEIVHRDAARFDVPDDPCVFFFYNPFSDELLRLVLAQLIASFAAKPRKLVLLFARQKSPEGRWAGLTSTETRVFHERMLPPLRSLWTHPRIEYFAFESHSAAT